MSTSLQTLFNNDYNENLLNSVYAAYINVDSIKNLTNISIIV